MTAVDSDRYMREIVNTINDGLFLVGPDGRIKMVNPALERLTGYTQEELLGKPCTILNCDVCHISRKQGREHWCKLFDDRAEHRRRCNVIRKDGTSVPVLKNASLLMDGETVVASVETLSDLSEVAERDRRIEALARLLDTGTGFHGMVGVSPAMRRVFEIVRKAAMSDAPVLILGESGTGKELIARAIHDLGPRSGGPYIQLNCAALNEALLESELFGHVKGAFTGAVRHRQGRFEAAHGGDIFLDEIGDVPLPIQVKLLRVLETKRIERVGDHNPVDVDVRVITATHQDLSALVRNKAFREDLLFRINVLPIRLPPLRERREDIPLLADHFLQAIRAKSGKPVEGLTPEALRLLADYPWPGNVRELRSALEYAFVLADAGRIGPEHLPAHMADSDRNEAVCPPPPSQVVDETLTALGRVPRASAMSAPAVLPPAPPATAAEAEKAALLDALRRANGNKSEAARLLGVHRGTVLNRMRKHGIGMHRTFSE